MGQNTNIINLVGNVANPVSTSQPDGSAPLLSSGRQAELLVSEIHGKYYTSAYRKNVFKFNVTAVTVPHIASGMVSVFSLWNPPQSNVIGELISTDIVNMLATTVVDAFGWYFSASNLALAGTFSTPSVANTNHFSGRLGETPGNLVQAFTSYTHSGTPVRVDIIGGHGAATNATALNIHKDYDGRVLIPPGTVISVGTSTTVATTSGLDLEAVWSEWPL
jgi:hypothetical protein